MDQAERLPAGRQESILHAHNLNFDDGGQDTLNKYNAGDLHFGTAPLYGQAVSCAGRRIGAVPTGR